MGLAVAASSRETASGVAGLASDDKAVTALRGTDSLRVGREASSGAGEADVGGLAGGAGRAAGEAAIAGIEVLSTGAADGLEGQFIANSIGVHVESTGAGAAVDGGVEDCVERAGGACALEGELVASTGKNAVAAGTQGVASGADALAVGDDLVQSAGVAVSIGVQQLVVLALADADRALDDLSGRAGAAVAVVDKAAGANCADSVDEETIGKCVAGCANAGAVEGEPLLAGAFSTQQHLVDSAGRARRSSVVSGSRAGRTDLAGSVDSAKPSDAAAGLGGGVVNFIGSAFPSADAPLVGEETVEAVAVLGS